MGSIPLLATQIQVPTPRDPLEEFARAAGLKSQLQQQQLQQQQLEQNNRALQDQQATTKAMLGWDGKSYEDLAHSVLTNGGSANAALGIQQHGLAIRDTASQIAQRDADAGSKHVDTIIKQHDQVLGALQSLDNVPDEELSGSISNLTQQFQKQGLLEPPLAQKAMQIAGLPAQQARQQLQLFEKNLQGQKSQFEQAKDLASQKLEQSKVDFQKQEFAAKMPGGPLADVSKTELADYLKNPRLDPGIQKDAATFAAWKAKQTPTMMVMGNMLGKPGGGSALDQAAERYSASGELPAGFSRSPGTTAAIINRSAQLHPDQSIAGNKAVFAATKSALTQLQSQAAKVDAFEATAGKNLDQFLETANHITDLGAKFANMPIRAVQDKMLGTADIAAFNAARTVALTEIARVLNSPTGAGVLSDSARHEAEGLIGENATLESIKRAAGILRQDMKNRKQSYADSIAELQKQLGGSTPNPPSDAPAPAAGASFFEKFHGVARKP